MMKGGWHGYLHAAHTAPGRPAPHRS
jgi:hypothetical protein